MVDPQQSQEIFRFFELPLEMREMIYDGSLHNRKGSLKCGGLDYKAINMARMNLLLVCKQFKQEYEAWARKVGQVLLLQDTYDSINSEAFMLPFPKTAYTNITVSVIIHPDDPDGELDLHKDWLPALMTTLAAFSTGTTLQLNIQMSHLDIANRDHHQELEELVCEVARLSPVSYDANVYGASCGESFSGLKSDSVLSMTWSRDKQKLERIPVKVAES